MTSQEQFQVKQQRFNHTWGRLLNVLGAILLICLYIDLFATRLPELPYTMLSFIFFSLVGISMILTGRRGQQAGYIEERSSAIAGILTRRKPYMNEYRGQKALNRSRTYFIYGTLFIFIAVARFASFVSILLQR